MTKTVYYNYLIAEDESVIKTLSDLGFSGKYKFLDGKLYVYFQKNEEGKYFVCFGKYPLIVKSKGYISIGQLSKIIKVDNFELSSTDKQYNKKLDAYTPVDNVFEKTKYTIKVGEIVDKI